MNQDDRYRRAQGGPWKYQPQPHKRGPEGGFIFVMAALVGVLLALWVGVAIVRMVL